MQPSPAKRRAGWLIPLLLLLGLAVAGSAVGLFVLANRDNAAATRPAKAPATEVADRDVGADTPEPTDAPPTSTVAPTDTPMPTVTLTPIPTLTPLPTLTSEPGTAVEPEPGSAGPVTFDVVVEATTERSPTGVQIDEGQEVTIQYLSGSWRAGPAPTWSPVGPKGDNQVPSKLTFPIPDSSLMTLVGGVGLGGPALTIGERLTFTSSAAGELWLGPNDDGAGDNSGELLVRVTLGEVESVAWTPLSGTGLQQLSFGPERDYTPAISPDQTRLIYSSELDGGWQLVEGDLTGGGRTSRLTSGQSDYNAPDFSPDGAWLLVSSNLDGDFDIYLLDSATAEVAAQLTDLAGDEYLPRWLRDGTGFIFSWQQGDVEAIYHQSLDGARTELVRATTFEGFASPSPDGRQVAFYSGRDGDYELYTMAIDGSNPRRLTVSRGRDASPSFSPDGSWIAFESARNGDYDLYAVRPDGSDLRQLTSDAANDWYPTFSPDGQWLLFQSDRAGEMDVFRMPFTP
jgi:TolB protein